MSRNTAKAAEKRQFYRTVFGIAVPVMIQNGITNFVGVLDNIMVGQLGTEQMSGVAIANQLLFVYYLCIFGALSGIGIFTAQYYGAGDHEGIRHTFRFKIAVSLIFTLLSTALFAWKGEELISLFLSDDATGDINATLRYGLLYLAAMYAGLPANALKESFAQTLREVGQTAAPMAAGLASVFVNLFLNWVLIFGKLGAPAMGVTGAAVATVISRYCELLIIFVYIIARRAKYPFITGAFRSLYIPAKLMGRITVKALPLTANEILWSVGMSFLMQCYSTRGLSVVAAVNITNTASNLFNVVFFSMGSAAAIIVGQQLGANRMKEARASAYRLIATGVVLSMIVAAALAAASPYIPLLYNTSDAVRVLSSKLMLCTAACMPIMAFIHVTYFTLRSGGRTFITFLFDSLFVWALTVPMAFVLSRYTDMPIIPLYLCTMLIDIIKCVIGFVLVRKGIWINNIIEEGKARS